MCCGRLLYVRSHELRKRAYPQMHCIKADIDLSEGLSVRICGLSGARYVFNYDSSHLISHRRMLNDCCSATASNSLLAAKDTGCMEVVFCDI